MAKYRVSGYLLLINGKKSLNELPSGMRCNAVIARVGVWAVIS